MQITFGTPRKKPFFLHPDILDVTLKEIKTPFGD
jgi:hypothetical protein